MKLKIASSQFSVGPDIEENKSRMIGHIKRASRKGARVIHFPESSLTGYPGQDMESFENFDWELLKNSSEEIAHQAEALNIWVIFGSAHPLSPPHKPHNSLYIINDMGELHDRYDKLFCASNEQPISGELSHFSPGDHFSIFEIDGIRCSCLICHDYRYPELYRELKIRGVELVFHSFYAGNLNDERRSEMESQVGKDFLAINPGKTIPGITMPATMISYAANNYIWISCSNTSVMESCWPAFVVRPDGVTVGRLNRNEENVLITMIDSSESYYDSTKFWRERAISGIYHSGDKVNDVRSFDRKSF